MFSSTTNINPFAHFPSSSYPSLPTLTSQDSGDVLLHLHHDLLSRAILVPDNPQVTEYLISMPMLNNPTMTKKVDVIHTLNGGFLDGSGFLPQKKPAKKDRHSKICTAQGVRDRRVRLSIEIAREFFDLQDMLGFDKASKTLGWLLTKSKSAIKELAKMKGIQSARSSTSECEVASEGGELGRAVSRSEALLGVSNEKKMKKSQKASTIHLPAKESREKARARARERAREKMFTPGIYDLKTFPETSPEILNQFKSHNILPQEVEELDSNLAQRELDFVQKRKMPTAILGYQQNPYFPDFPNNWNINGEVGHSTISAVTNLNL
ncbi:hypothetical protein SLA2020_152580 [Shorea laevis]